MKTRAAFNLVMILGVLISSFNVHGKKSDVDVVEETAHQMGISSSRVRESLSSCDASQWAMNVCSQYYWIEQDILMNNVIKNVLEDLDGSSSREKFLLAQESWVNFRDRDCEYRASGVEGGTMHAMVELDCKRDLTKARILELKEFRTCRSPGCPGSQ